MVIGKSNLVIPLNQSCLGPLNLFTAFFLCQVYVYGIVNCDILRRLQIECYDSWLKFQQQKESLGPSVIYLTN